MESPLVTIWEAPRATIRRIVATDPGRNVTALLFASGAVGLVESITGEPLTFDWSPVLLAAAAAGVGLAAVVLGRLWAAYQRWVGGLLGGVASQPEVLASYAWGMIPATAITALVVLARFAVFGTQVLHVDQPNVEAASALLTRTLSLATSLGGIWSGTVAVVCYAEVNAFSIWRAIGAAILGSVLLFVVVALPLGAVALWFWAQ